MAIGRSALVACQDATTTTPRKQTKGAARGDAFVSNTGDYFSCSTGRQGRQKKDSREGRFRSDGLTYHLPRRRRSPSPCARFTSGTICAYERRLCRAFLGGCGSFSLGSTSFYPQRIAHSYPSQAKVQEWISRRPEFLYELLRLETLLPQDVACSACKSPAVYRCLSCFPSEVVCEGCLVSRHSRTPLHSIQVCSAGARCV